MSSFEDRISWAALILSVAAFIISVSQMLQQYFATAEGYRRCQDSVIGRAWFQYTKRKFRFSEFRFETLFQAPHIRIGAFVTERADIINNSDHQDYLLVNANSKLVTDGGDRKENDFARVCWLDFLEELNTFHTALASSMMAVVTPSMFSPTHQAPQNYVDKVVRTNQTCLAFPTFLRVSQSWDFMPPDAVKPLARIDVCDLAICVRRLGMRWSQFQPHDGLVRAESNQLIVTSTYLRSMGCCVNISRLSNGDGKPKNGGSSSPHFYIPDLQADAMGFGLLPVSATSGFKEPFKIGTIDELRATVEQFEFSGDASKRMDSLQSTGFLYSFLDLIPLVAPFMRRRASQVVKVPSPLDRPSWIFISSTGRTAFAYLLREQIGQLNQRGIRASSKLESLLESYDDLDRTFPRWCQTTEKDYGEAMSNEQPIKFLEEVHDFWDDIENYFQGQEAASNVENGSGEPSDRSHIYNNLVKVHLRHAVLAESYADRILSHNERRKLFPLGNRIKNVRMAETLAQYFYRLEPMRKEMNNLGHSFGEASFLEIWAHLMVRGFCWHHCHTMVAGMTVPSEYWNSRLPIYIG